MIGRRALLGAAAVAAFSRRAAGQRERGGGLMPAGYVGHGSPMLAIDPVRAAELRAWGASLPQPTGIVAITPHYRARGLRVGHVGRGRGLYSFPEIMRRSLPGNLDYPSPDNQALAHVVSDLLAPLEPTFDEGRSGFDHTTWMPLMHLFPKADVPVVEIALPFAEEHELFSLGRRLSLLRHQGVFILASGSLTHNLASIRLGAPTSRSGSSSPVAPEFGDFDAWVEKALTDRDVPSLLAWRSRAPRADLVHPDDGGHFRVLLVALGAVASGDTFASATFPVTGFEMGTQSKLCVELH